MSYTQGSGQGRRFTVTVRAAVTMLLLVVLGIRPAEAQSASCSWRIVQSPNTTATGGHRIQNQLEAVIALSPTDAWAVGDGDFAIMIQHWDGDQWTIFPAPAIPGATQSKLLGIDAAAPNDIWAVGYYIGDGWHPLAIHFDGNQWSIVPVPSNLGTFNAPDILALNSVTVISANDAWAVGGDARSFGIAQSEGGLQLHWDGVAWTPAFPPAGTGFGYSLAAVTSVATNNVIAAGPVPPWSYHWNGSQWTQENSLLGNNFIAIDTVDAQNVMAVGTQPRFTPSESGPIPARPISRLFNGTDWLSSSAPSSRPQLVNTSDDQGFYGVSALSANEIWAVGFAGDFTMAQRWDGAQWSIVPSANGNPAGATNRNYVNVLLGVDALSATDGWAVGYYYDQTPPYGEQRSLILRYVCDGVGDPTPTPTPSPGATPDTLYVSSTTGGNVGGVGFSDEDVLVYDISTGSWSMFFDGSDVGLASADVDAFALLNDGSLLLSFNNPLTVNGIVVDDSDVLRFAPTSLGAATAGSFSMYIDGSDVGLTTNGEDIDSLSVVNQSGNGVTVLIGTTGNFNVAGAVGNDEDLAQLTASQTGNTTIGVWSFYFDGSDVGLADSDTEDVLSASLVDGNLYLTTLGAFAVSGASGDGSDVLRCGSLVSGSATSCTFSLFLDGATIGIGSEVIDGLLVK